MISDNKKTKKILIIDTGKEWGGGTNSLLELLKRVERTKYHFTALFYANYRQGSSSSVKAEMERLGIGFHHIEQNRSRFPIKVLKELLRILFFFSRPLQKRCIFLIDYLSRIRKNSNNIVKIIDNQKIDLLYMNNQPSSNLEGIIAAEKAGIPVIQHARIETGLNPVEIRACNRTLAKIICVSEGIRDSFVRQGLNPSLCVVVHNGISSDLTPLTPPLDVRRIWNIPPSNIIVGTVGSLLKRKRIHELIEVLHVITSTTDLDVTCLITGEGPQQRNLDELAHKRKLHDHIIFTGFQPDAVSYINAMDIFVMPSEKEGLPRVVLEAMLMRKPVVASDVIGNSELVEHEKTGFLIQQGDTQKFADAIIVLIKNSELRKKMGDSAYKRVVDFFSIEKYINGVEAVFAEILR